MSNIFKLFSNCFLVKGYNRGLIVDTQRKKYFAVPLAMIAFLEQAEGKDIASSISAFAETEEDSEILNEYISFLFDNELVFTCSSIEEYNRFPAISLDWQYPAHITNSVIEVNSIDDIKRFNSFQGAFFIPFVQFIIRREIKDVLGLKQLVYHMHLRNARGIQVLFDNSMGFSENILVGLCNEFPLIESLIAFNSAYDKTLRSLKTFLVFCTQKEYSSFHCGVVNAKYFNPLFEHYAEGQQYNTCLNRKLAIDIDGNIRNCLSMPDSYGNISNTSIKDVISSQSFQKYWSITKDAIAVCKDCEFRYICTDCRAYVEDPGDMHSKPLKCGYDPYTSEWQDWSTHPMKQKAIAYYNIPVSEKS